MNFTKPVKIAEDIYWIGKYLEGDPFQCHPYMINNGSESILIDPGSLLELDAVVEKIGQVTSLANVKYIVLHHQDPDLCASVPHLEKMIGRDDLHIVTHSRLKLQIKHYGVASAYYEVDKEGLALETANGLKLQFITTPYCHSPGAFVTYVPSQKVLFSSDIFGGLEESWQFYADETYFEKVKSFHQTYMPSRDILNYALRTIEALDLELIAPQHGSIVKKEFIAPLIAKMKRLECGLYIEKEYKRELTKTIEKLEKEREMKRRSDAMLFEQSKLAQMGEMVNMIAHQWRQPINALSAIAIKLEMKSSMNMLQMAEVEESARDIQQIVQEMSQIINDFLNFTKSSGNIKSVSIQEILDEILKLVKAQLSSNNIQFIVENDKNIVLVSSKSDIMHILLNLISNARDALDEKEIDNKMIWIRVYKKENDIYIEVEDNAGGIDDKLKGRIFEPYFTTKEPGKGTGLGLYMSKKMARERLHGDLTMENTDKGAKFTLKIPSAIRKKRNESVISPKIQTEKSSRNFQPGRI